MLTHGETIDLTEPNEITSTQSEHPRSQQSVKCNESSAPITTSAMMTGDHMHSVVDLLRQEPIDLVEDELQSHYCEIGAAAASPRHRRRDPHDFLGRADTENPLTGRNSVILSPIRQPPATMPQRKGPGFGKKSIQPLPFMDFPPEIRNTVYRLLLTTPNAPIEFQGYTGLHGAKRRAQWAKCKSSKMKRRHKKIFLEILEVCKQIHDEASGIIYGCNVFKYRSNPGDGPRLVVLPTRHLQLLKHIKVSVISRHPCDDQHRWVADLIKQFQKDCLKLETFEVTWFGWVRCHLRKNGPVCQALRLLQVGRLFIVKVTGEARMDKETQQDLERSLISRKVEIQRPVKANTGEDLSDDDPV